MLNIYDILLNKSYNTIKVSEELYSSYNLIAQNQQDTLAQGSGTDIWPWGNNRKKTSTRGDETSFDALF